ncbi:MAG: type II secretion system protein GspC [Deltaproteobacteria bacterium]
MFVTILKKYIWVVNLLLLTGLAYLAALTVNQKLEGMVTSSGAIASQRLAPPEDTDARVSNVRHPLTYYNVILKRNVFGISGLSEDSTHGGKGESLPDTTLDVVLLGTIINSDGSSKAIIKNPANNKVNGYSGGEEIHIIEAEKVTLVEVMNCSAVIQRQKNGRETIKCRNLGEEVSKSVKTPTSRRAARSRNPAGKRNTREAEDSEGINKIGESEYEISRELLEDLLSDPTNIVQQARVIPQSDGLRFFGIRSNSIFWKIGIKNGDTLHRINNVELNDVERALGVFEELRAQSYFTIDFTRAGKEYSYEYTVK